MFCPKCGRENQQGVKFCGGCGTRLGQNQLDSSSVPEKAPVKPAKPAKPAKKAAKKKNYAKVWLSILLCLVLIILVGCLVWLAIRLVFPEEKKAEIQTTPESIAVPEETTPWWEFPANASYGETEEFCAQREAEGDYLSAVMYLNNRIAQGEQDTRYLQLQSRYESMHIASVMDIVNAYVGRGQYQLALDTLWDAEEAYPCDTFRWEREALEKRMYVPLTSCQKLEDTNSLGKVEDVVPGSWRDSHGTIHDASLRFWVVDREGWNNTEYITYALEGKYKTLTGQIVSSEKSEPSSHGVIMIYLDDKLVYTSQEIYYDTQPVELEINVTDAQQIRVVCTTESSEFNYTILEAGLSEN